jgi:hypothetical protein
MNNQKQMPDRGITASAIKNVSMTYVPRDMSLCLFLSRRGCSKLLTIDNKCRGPVLSLQPFPARSQEQHGRAPLFAEFKQMQFISASNKSSKQASTEAAYGEESHELV